MMRLLGFTFLCLWTGRTLGNQSSHEERKRGGSEKVTVGHSFSSQFPESLFPRRVPDDSAGLRHDLQNSRLPLPQNRQCVGWFGGRSMD
jgi:hypothetical protein